MASPADDRTLARWVADEAVSFSLEPADAFEDAISRVMTSLGDGVEVLGLGEPTHGIGEFLLLRNRLFQRLVEAHGYSAVAIESSYPRSQLVHAYVTGSGPASYEQVQQAGFSHGFGELAATASWPSGCAATTPNAAAVWSCASTASTARPR